VNAILSKETSLGDQRLIKTLEKICAFYDARKVGETGALGFRRSSDLKTVLRCLDRLIAEKAVERGRALFLDLGCADGRVNVLLSYLVRLSVGVELDEWTLAEYRPLRDMLEEGLRREGLEGLGDNIRLFKGDCLTNEIHGEIRRETGFGIEHFDVFYTYLVMHEEIASLIRERGKRGALLLVYGVDRIIPSYRGLDLLPFSPMEGRVAAYVKI
jgi:hypothetical protein